MALVARKVHGAALNTWITGALHYILTKGPDRLRLPSTAFLNTRFGALATERVVKALRILWWIGLITKVNAKLNDVALNSWKFKSQKDKWVWNWEIAVVTGGSSGIGKEIVKGLAAAGVQVAVLDIQELPADLQRNAKVTYIHCDVTSPSSIAAASKQVRAELGDPTILVNNAGIGAPHSLLEESNEYVTKIFQINIISHFWLVKEFLPDMIKKNKGHIVGLASMASFVCPPGIVSYGSTKAAVMAFHEGLAQELKHIHKAPGVLNTIVHPSWVATPLVGGYENHLEKTQGKLMKPEMVGKKIVAQITSCRSGQLILPEALKTAAGIRGHPNWLQELIRDLAVGRAGSEYKKNNQQ